MEKIGVFGGTFNPPHIGHVRLAAAAADALGLDRVLIMPACVPPHKLPAALAGGADRLEMCRLAFGEDPRFAVSDLELRRGSRSYTVETLRTLHAEYPAAELWFIAGSDMLATFRQWYRWEEILSLARLCAASRSADFVPDLSGFTPAQQARITVLPIAPLEASSTEVREALRSGRTTALLQPQVLGYIQTHGLYADGLSAYRALLRDRLDDKRLHHSECVSDAAAMLAAQYGWDPEKARLAGLLHDITKNESLPEQQRLIEADGGELTALELQNPKVWHQRSGAAFLRLNGLVTDPEILNAVACHTTGKAGMTLPDKILYIADFISAERDYPDVEVVRRLAALSLEHAILYTSRYTVVTLTKMKRPLHSATLACYADMLRHFGLIKEKLPNGKDDTA
ncbi:MAG: nicotinate (nicotinamide) nucleotide adenylyltransferase [Clostridia bacterium]|nr:nicotinate (nicotinamide) nucleotide adenylyltransferase [Clostridia bacterium]